MQYLHYYVVLSAMVAPQGYPVVQSYQLYQRCFYWLIISDFSCDAVPL